MILSVDLASRRYADNGIALMWADGPQIGVRLISPGTLGLQDPPEPQPFAEALHRLAATEKVGLIALDGPQGWRRDHSEFVHLRRCESEARTPGKTGLPGVVKPATWTRMAEFSIAVFDALDARGWPRLGADARSSASLESFPTQAWRSLGVAPLPGKSRKPDLHDWHRVLACEGVAGLGTQATHDDLQAVVAGLGALQLHVDGWDAVDRFGEAPRREGGSWREGYIIAPRPRAPLPSVDPR